MQLIAHNGQESHLQLKSVSENLCLIPLARQKYMPQSQHPRPLVEEAFLPIFFCPLLTLLAWRFTHAAVDRQETKGRFVALVPNWQKQTKLKHGVAMVPPFDILRQESDGSLRWIQAADSLEAAKSRIEVLAVSLPGAYVIFNQNTGNKMVIEDGCYRILCE